MTCDSHMDHGITHDVKGQGHGMHVDALHGMKMSPGTTFANKAIIRSPQAT